MSSGMTFLDTFIPNPRESLLSSVCTHTRALASTKLSKEIHLPGCFHFVGWSFCPFWIILYVLLRDQRTHVLGNVPQAPSSFPVGAWLLYRCLQTRSYLPPNLKAFQGEHVNQVFMRASAISFFEVVAGVFGYNCNTILLACNYMCCKRPSSLFTLSFQYDTCPLTLLMSVLM